MIFLFLNLGGGEILLVLLVVLMFFGSKSIPDLARGLGKGLREIREATDNIKREIENGTSQIKSNMDVTTSSPKQKDIEEIIEEETKKPGISNAPLDQQLE